MHAFLIVCVEVPEHVRIRYVRLRVSFVTPVHTWKLDGIADKEDCKIVENEVLISFFSEELDGKSSYVPDRIAASFLTGDC